MPEYILTSRVPFPDMKELIRCRDCDFWEPGYITDHDDFIPPRCTRKNLIGASADEWCSRAKRREE